MVAQWLESVLRVVKASPFFSGGSEMLMFHVWERVPTHGSVMCRARQAVGQLTSIQAAGLASGLSPWISQFDPEAR